MPKGLGSQSQRLPCSHDEAPLSTSPGGCTGLPTSRPHQLAHEQIGWWERVPIVTVGIAIEQCIDSGVPTHLIKQALDTAARRGAVRVGDLDRLSATLEARND